MWNTVVTVCSIQGRWEVKMMVMVVLNSGSLKIHLFQ